MSKTKRQKRLTESNRQNCSSKVPYASSKAAWAAIHGQRRQGRGFILRAYKCKSCGQWHVGNDYRPRTPRW